MGKIDKQGSGKYNQVMDSASISTALVEIEVKTPGALSNLVITFLFFLPFLITIIVFGILIKTIISKSSSSHAKKIAGFSLIAIFSIIIVFASLYLPKTFYNQNDMNNVRCGFPLEFFVYSSGDSPLYPWTQSCIDGLDYGPPKQFIWPSFFIDVGIVYIVLWLFCKIVKKNNLSKIK